MAKSTSKAEYFRKRKNLIQVISTKELAAIELRVMNMVRKLCRNVKKTSGKSIAPTDLCSATDGAFDLRSRLNIFSYDAITAMSWFNTYGFLHKGNYVCSARASNGEFRQLHAMNIFCSAST